MKSTLNQNPTHDLTLPLCFPPGWKITRLALSQFVAGIIMTYCVIDSYAKIQRPTAQFSQCSYISLSMFFTFVICGQLSGGHGNPIITLALLFNRGSQMNFLKCLIYIVCQYAGCFVGGAVAFATVYPIGDPQADTGISMSIPQIFGCQVVGSFMFICLYLIIMSAATRFESNFWCYFLVPMAYYISSMMTYQYTGLNPITAMGNQLYYSIKQNQFQSLQSYWAYVCGPLVGGITASVFMNFIILPLYHKLSAQKKQ